MAWKPDDFQSITGPVHATPYPSASNILIAYPRPLDWQHVYDPNHWKDGKWLIEHYDDMARSHEHSVMRQLNLIFSQSTGRVVCAELRERSSYYATILPFDFLPRAYWNPGRLAHTRPADRGGVSADEPLDWASYLRVRSFREQFTFPRGTGTGGTAVVYYTASRHTDRPPDQALLHELVHASRIMKGFMSTAATMGGGYGNQEEFLAVLVQNIYRSEKELPPEDYQGNPIEPRSLLDDIAWGRKTIDRFRNEQPTLYSSLYNIKTSFNPIRQFEDERKAGARK